MMAHLRSFLVTLGLFWCGGSVAWADNASLVADRGCAALASRVDGEAGGGPLFLRSFDGAEGSGPAVNPALATAAFTYDNALAAIALVACDRLPQARRIGEALLAATLHDRAGAAQGRLRNAYRAGPQAETPLPNGWWDRQWLEDDYQLGTATGNVAWAALALLTLAEQTGDTRFRDGAAILGRWVVSHTADSHGFNGGIFGGEAVPRRLTWKSTEHNTDLEALFRWLARAAAPGPWGQQAAVARAFIDSQWDEASGHFFTGTTLDGVSVNRATSGLDAQFWPLLLPDAPDKWRRALDYADRAHGVPGGFAFNSDHSGLWVEGTAQAALAFRVAGQGNRADLLLQGLTSQVSPGGYLWATPQARISTGLAIGPDSTEADFFYYHLPHLGATAWAVIAAKGWNPFLGRR